MGGRCDFRFVGFGRQKPEAVTCVRLAVTGKEDHADVVARHVFIEPDKALLDGSGRRSRIRQRANFDRSVEAPALLPFQHVLEVLCILGRELERR
jgi:hypothetical protein